MDLKQYGLTYTRSHPPIERQDGEWVKASDFRLLLAENQRQKETISRLEEWIAGIADDHPQIPEWIQQSAKSLLAQGAE